MFDPTGNYVENISTGDRLHFDRENDVYVLNVWLQVPKEHSVGHVGEGEQGFTRLVQ